MTNESASVTDQRLITLEIEKHAHDRWWHEDELVNQRTTWLLTTQGVLGTAYGFILYRIAEVTYSLEISLKFNASKYIEALATLANFVVIIGVGSSFFSALGILAACIAQHALRKKCGSYLGVTRRTTIMGQGVALATPFLCMGAWIGSWLYFQDWKHVPDLISNLILDQS
jgi:hypothetical protein